MNRDQKRQQKAKERQEKLAQRKAHNKDQNFKKLKKMEQFNFGKVVVLTIAAVVLGVIIILNLAK